MENFAETLSKENLRFHPQFVALEKEIRKGEAGNPDFVTQFNSWNSILNSADP